MVSVTWQKQAVHANTVMQEGMRGRGQLNGPCPKRYRKDLLQHHGGMALMGSSCH